MVADWIYPALISAGAIVWVASIIWQRVRYPSAPGKHPAASWVSQALSLAYKSRQVNYVVDTEPANSYAVVEADCRLMERQERVTLGGPLYDIATHGEDYAALFDVSAEEHLRNLESDPGCYDRLRTS